MLTPAQIVARESRWARLAGVAALLAVVCVVASNVVARLELGVPDGDAALLVEVNAHATAQILAGVLQAIGVGLLAIPLVYLFRAAEARSEKVRGQLIGIVIAGPLFLAVLAILLAVSTVSAADDWVTNQVPELLAKNIALGSERANDLASDTISDASLRDLAVGFGIGGQIGFVVAMFYTCLHAMRAGLLTRFWGSLGLALAAISVFFFQLTALWFVYAGLLIAAWPGRGRPPAWEEGRAIPWPTPGERAAAELSSAPDDDEPGREPPSANGSAEPSERDDVR